MKIEDQWFLKGFRRKYKMKKIYFKFQDISRWKTIKKGQKLQNSHLRNWLMHHRVTPQFYLIIF